MDDATKQFDPGSGPVVTTDGPDNPALVHAVSDTATSEPDGGGTVQHDGFLAMVEARLPRGYQLDPDDSLIKRYPARDDVVEISQPFYVKHLELSRPMRPAQLVVVLRTASGALREISMPADDLGKGAPKGVALLRGQACACSRRMPGLLICCAQCPMKLSIRLFCARVGPHSIRLSTSFPMEACRPGKTIATVLPCPVPR